MSVMNKLTSMNDVVCTSDIEKSLKKISDVAEELRSLRSKLSELSDVLNKLIEEVNANNDSKAKALEILYKK